MLAMERGEVEGVSGSWASVKAQRPHWLRDKQVNVIVQSGRAKHPDLPDVPMIDEFVKEPEHKVMWQVMVAMGLGRPLAAPPGVPAELVKILRAGFEATMKDPAFSPRWRNATASSSRSAARRCRHAAGGRRGAAGDAAEAQF